MKGSEFGRERGKDKRKKYMFMYMYMYMYIHVQALTENHRVNVKVFASWKTDRQPSYELHVHVYYTMYIGLTGLTTF